MDYNDVKTPKEISEEFLRQSGDNFQPNNEVLDRILDITQAEFAFNLFFLLLNLFVWKHHGWRNSFGWGMLLVYLCSQIITGGLMIGFWNYVRMEAMQNICYPFIMMAIAGIIYEGRRDIGATDATWPSATLFVLLSAWTLAINLWAYTPKMKYSHALSDGQLVKAVLVLACLSFTVEFIAIIHLLYRARRCITRPLGVYLLFWTLMALILAGLFSMFGHVWTLADLRATRPFLLSVILETTIKMTAKVAALAIILGVGWYTRKINKDPYAARRKAEREEELRRYDERTHAELIMKLGRFLTSRFPGKQRNEVKDEPEEANKPT